MRTLKIGSPLVEHIHWIGAGQNNFPSIDAVDILL